MHILQYEGTRSITLPLIHGEVRTLLILQSKWGAGATFDLLHIESGAADIEQLHTILHSCRNYVICTSLILAVDTYFNMNNHPVPYPNVVHPCLVQS